MNFARIFVGLLGTHALVATAAFFHGWLAGQSHEMRNHELDWREPVPMCDLADLAEPPDAYNWATSDSGLGSPGHLDDALIYRRQRAR